MEFTNIFDTHAHYYDNRFDSDREELLASLPEQGVSLVLEAGCDMRTSRWGVEYSKKYSHMYCSVGIHPSDSGTVSREDGYLQELESLSREKKVVAIGEIGLDYHYLDYSKEVQMLRFAEQLELARDLDLPVIIHDRDAHADILEMIKKYRPKGIVHCFSGSKEMAVELVKLGMYIGFTGVLTFSNARRALEAVDVIPLDRLVLETDCPYLAPHPNRGKINRSDYMTYTVGTLAELFHMPTEDMIKLTRRNAETLFCL